MRRVLELMYGQGKVAVSVKGTLNMQKLIQETVQYTTPDKVDQNDKTGLHDKRMNDCLPPILFSAIFKLLKVLPDTELDAC
mgnify:CR=1 FL=1